jgi:hypothetical protein
MSKLTALLAMIFPFFLAAACTAPATSEMASVPGQNTVQTLKVAVIFNSDGSGKVVKDAVLPLATRTQSIHVTAQLGQKNSLGRFNLIDADCRLAETFQAAVNKPPKSGSFSGESGVMTANFDPSDPRHLCNGRTYGALELYYEPKTPGIDTMSILIPGPDREVIEVNFVISTK